MHDKEEEGIGKSLFTHANGQSSNTFYDDKWRPEWLNEAGDDKTNMMAEIPDNVYVHILIFFISFDRNLKI